MKKLFLVGLAIGVLMFGMVDCVGAAVITYDPTDQFLDKDDTTRDFTLSLTSEGFQHGTVGNVGVDTLTSAFLEIFTYDDNDSQNEGYKFTLDTTEFNSAYNIINKSTFGNPDIMSISVGVFLQQDGNLWVQIVRQSGDFYFDKAVLTATWTDYVVPTNGGGTTAPVPEPATMLLLGTGLAGLAAARRRKAKKD